MTNGTTLTAYKYDASGKRVIKQIIDNTVPSAPVIQKTTYYVRDAQGNPLAIYDVAGGVTTLKEQSLYGSSRLGTWSPNINLTTATTSTTDINYNMVGQKYYELTNHLGNVMATITDKRLQTGSSTPYFLPDVITQQDYYAFGAPQPGDRTYVYLGHNAYRYGFNGKENDDDVGKGTGNQQDYGMRIYDPRVGRFFSEDPLTQKYPWYTPYQFAGNMPIQFVDLDGLEPAESGKKAGDYSVAIKKGTEDYYGWTWTLKGKRGAWKQGGSTTFKNGNIMNNGGHNDDNTKTFHPEVKVNSIWEDGFNASNNLQSRLGSFTVNFATGTSLEDSEKEQEATTLVNKFINGNPNFVLRFNTKSGMASLLSQDPQFLRVAHSFESQSIAYFNEHHNLEGFDGNNVLSTAGMPQIRDHLFMHAVMGGTQQWNAQIQKISANHITVLFTVWDRFGAGTDDAHSNLPGLSSLYWLQHNSSSFYPNTSNLYNPFIWNISVERKK